MRSDEYAATVLGCYTRLSTILGRVTEGTRFPLVMTGLIHQGIYRKRQRVGSSLIETVKDISDSLSTWFDSLPEPIQLDYFKLENIPRESVSIFLHYHQCINTAARPLLFHVIRKRLKAGSSASADWREGLVPEAVKMIDQCISTARGTVAMMISAFQLNLVGQYPIHSTDFADCLATYGFMDGEHAFSAALILAMVNMAFPHDDETAKSFEKAIQLLRGMAGKGNSDIRARLSMLLDLKEFPEKQRRSSMPNTIVQTSMMPTLDNFDYSEEMGMTEQAFGSSLTSEVGPDLQVLAEAGDMDGNVNFDWMEEAFRE